MIVIEIFPNNIYFGLWSLSTSLSITSAFPPAAETLEEAQGWGYSST
jgi:hypothetical protein